MKVIQINCDCGCYSTGKIVSDLSKELIKNGHDSLACYGRDFKETGIPSYKIGSKIGVLLHAFLSRIFDSCGLHSKHATRKLIKKIADFSPDIIHLHNLHGYYINYPMLFNFLKKYNKPVVWTLHDCWAFTGHCSYFTFKRCSKWKSLCSRCPQKKNYPKSICFDNSRSNYLLKKQLFSSLQNLTLVTPSNWLSGLVSQSFLKDKKIVCIRNGIDTSLFKKNEGMVQYQYNLQNKKIILGVASLWDKRKGFSDMISLSSILSSEYVLVLIGVSKKQMKHLPPNVLALPKTSNMNELIEWYSAAYCLVNPTYEDNYPTVNLEAQACGTPVITYKTGGSSESCVDEQVIECGNVCGLKSAIENLELQINKNLICDTKVMLKNYLSVYEECNKTRT